jgi:hypothetical protein
LTRIQLAHCCKTNFPKDWSSYWFYVKVDMSKSIFNDVSVDTLQVFS